MSVTLSARTLRERRGEEIAVTGWTTVTQEQIARFAEVAGDDQWIHVDPVRAAASPFGSTIAHGFLTLALLTPLLRAAVTVEGAGVAINYGLNRVRFVTPVPAGGRIRARFVPSEVEERPAALHVTWTVTFDLEGGEKPACVAEWIVRYPR